MKRLKPLIAVVAFLLIGAFLAWIFMKGGQEMMDSDEEAPVESPSRVSVQGGEKVITLDIATRIKSGIETEALKPAMHTVEIRAYGIVLGIGDLIDLRKGYADAKAAVEKTEARLVASRTEYARLKALNEENRNVSDKALEAAQALLSSDSADAAGAEEALRALRAGALQRWGGVITGWVYGDSGAFRRLAGQKDLLVQVTLPREAGLVTAPHIATVRTRDGRFVRARPVSPAPSTDPRIQGASFFYTVSSKDSGLLPGMNVTAYLPGGPEIRGIIVPSSAIVWWQGRAWVYARSGMDRLVRREVSSEMPVKGGLFTSKGFREGDEIITKGAELFLSEEFRAQIKTSD